MLRLFQTLVRHCLLLLFITGYCQTVHAGQLNLIVNGKAIHLGVPTGMTMNEENWGLGLQYDYELIDDKWIPFATISGFIDSLDNPSYYAGGGILRRYSVGQYKEKTLHFDIGAIAFLMTREDHKNNEPFPGVLPVFSFGSRKAAINITYIPKIQPKLVPLWFLQLKFAL